MYRNGGAQACAAITPADGLIGLGKTLEDLILQCLLNADTGIFNFKSQAYLGWRGMHHAHSAMNAAISVNLTALDNKLISTCRNSRGSPRSQAGTSGATTYSNISERCRAWNLKMSTVVPIKRRRSKSISSTTRKPTTNNKKSSTSSINASIV